MVEIKNSISEDGNVEILYGPQVKQLLDLNTKKRLLETYRIEESRNVLSGVLDKPTMKEIDAEDMEYDLKGLDKIIENENLFVLTVDGKVAGMIGYTEIGKMPEDGRTVYMGTRLIVLPEFRGKKLSTKLMEYANTSFRDRFPNTPLLNVTRNNLVKKMSQGEGWEEIGEEASMAISGQQEYLQAHKAEFERRRDEGGWTAFLFDPKKLKQSKK